MDKSLVLDEMFFDGDMLTVKGQEFLDIEIKDLPDNKILCNYRQSNCYDGARFHLLKAGVRFMAIFEDGNRRRHGSEDGVLYEYAKRQHQTQGNEIDTTPWVELSNSMKYSIGFCFLVIILINN